MICNALMRDGKFLSFTCPNTDRTLIQVEVGLAGALGNGLAETVELRSIAPDEKIFEVEGFRMSARGMGDVTEGMLSDAACEVGLEKTLADFKCALSELTTASSQQKGDTPPSSPASPTGSSIH